VPALANLFFRVLRDPNCQKERTKEKRTHHILRFEFYVECSCGFKGRSCDHACPKCGAEIDFGFSLSRESLLS
jgi:hypothetical protein